MFPLSFFDLKKAFDSVPHLPLLHVWSSVCVVPNLLFVRNNLLSRQGWFGVVRTVAHGDTGVSLICCASCHGKGKGYTWGAADCADVNKMLLLIKCFVHMHKNEKNGVANVHIANGSFMHLVRLRSCEKGNGAQSELLLFHVKLSLESHNFELSHLKKERK